MATTKYIVDNVTGQTITGDLTINGNFTITGTTNTRPYKVYTALLTQSGGDSDAGLIDNGIVVGVTYRITPYGNEIGVDFTNIGAPNNNAGTYFVATGITPNSWGINTNDSWVLQYNSGAPVVTVLENTIGNVYWLYDVEGYYTGNLTNGFIGNLFFSNSRMVFYSGNLLIGLGVIDIYKNDDNQIGLDTFIAASGFATNGALINTPIEIRIYN